MSAESMLPSFAPSEHISLERRQAAAAVAQLLVNDVTGAHSMGMNVLMMRFPAAANNPTTTSTENETSKKPSDCRRRKPVSAPAAAASHEAPHCQAGVQAKVHANGSLRAPAYKWHNVAEGRAARARDALQLSSSQRASDGERSPTGVSARHRRRALPGVLSLSAQPTSRPPVPMLDLSASALDPLDFRLARRGLLKAEDVTVFGPRHLEGLECRLERAEELTLERRLREAEGMLRGALLEAGQAAAAAAADADAHPSSSSNTLPPLKQTTPDALYRDGDSDQQEAAAPSSYQLQWRYVAAQLRAACCLALLLSVDSAEAAAGSFTSTRELTAPRRGSGNLMHHTRGGDGAPLAVGETMAEELTPDSLVEFCASSLGTLRDLRRERAELLSRLPGTSPRLRLRLPGGAGGGVTSSAVGPCVDTASEEVADAAVGEVEERLVGLAAALQAEAERFASINGIAPQLSDSRAAIGSAVGGTRLSSPMRRERLIARPALELDDEDVTLGLHHLRMLRKQVLVLQHAVWGVGHSATLEAACRLADILLASRMPEAAEHVFQHHCEQLSGAPLKEFESKMEVVASSYVFDAVAEDHGELCRGTLMLGGQLVQDGLSALHEAAARGCENVLVALLQAVPTPDVRDDASQRTPLMAAAAAGHARVAALLLGCGAFVDAVDRVGQTPLMLAAGGGHAAVVQVLLAARARTDLRDQAGVTARELCAGHPEPLALLEAAERRLQGRAASHGLLPPLKAATANSQC